MFMISPVTIGWMAHPDPFGSRVVYTKYQGNFRLTGSDAKSLRNCKGPQICSVCRLEAVIDIASSQSSLQRFISARVLYLSLVL